MTNQIFSKRGMMLESIINKTINFYRKNDIAIIHKISIPIKFKKIEQKNNKLTLKDAFITSKSTVDYYGLCYGKFFAFDAKSTKNDKWLVSNIHPHQMNYLKSVNKHNGRAFIILGFITYNRYFIIFVENILKLERKSISLEFALNNFQELRLSYPGVLDFIEWI